MESRSLWLRVIVDSPLVRLNARHLGVSPVGDGVPRSGFRRVEEYGRPGRDQWSVAFDLLVKLKQPATALPELRVTERTDGPRRHAQGEDDCTDVQVHGSGKFLAVVQHQKAGL